MILIIVVGGFCTVWVFRHSTLLTQTQSNIQNLQALWAIQGSPPGSATSRYSEGVSPAETCAHTWNLAILNRYDGNLVQQATLLNISIECNPRYIHLAQAVTPDDLEMAKNAVEIYPDNLDASKWYANLLVQNKAYLDAVPVIWKVVRLTPVDEQAWLLLGTALSKLPAEDAAQLAVDLDLQGWAESQLVGHVEALFTLARVTGMSDPEKAVALYHKGFALKPHDGRRWRELGDILYAINIYAAIDAYLESCMHGDPGSNGCYRAGLTAESIGDLENAIKYLRMSRSAVSQQRADDIEARLNGGLP